MWRRLFFLTWIDLIKKNMVVVWIIIKMIDIEVKDHNSKIIHLIPNHLKGPVAFIAKIRGFESLIY